MTLVRQNTSITVVIGPILDADGVAKTDEVAGSIRVHKNGGVAATLDEGILAHSHTGYYRLTISTMDLDTVGQADFTLNSGTNSMPVKSLQVIEEAVYDALYAASAVGPATASVLGTPAGASIAADIAAIAADLPIRPAKNVALNNFEFLMVLSSDNVTPATGLTVTAERSIDGAAFAACDNVAAEVSAGVYVIDFSAADRNGDIITYKFSAATASTRYITIISQPT